VTRLRSSEWLVAAYFFYTAALAAIRIPASAWKAVLVLVLVCSLLWVLARTKSVVRDFVPVLYALIAYRQMDWFASVVKDGRLERAWVQWDRALLDGGLRGAIEASGGLVPGLLELSYLLVYGAAPVAVGILFVKQARERADLLWLAYLTGTLGAYALFPYFPSDPPRTVFPGADLPGVSTVMRWVNLQILGNYGIHTSVFPSAHVSSVFSAAWGLIAALPNRKEYGIGMAVYGAIVGIATIYGRYHYAADVASGIAISGFAAAAVAVRSLLLRGKDDV
jgi:membrane-associated phospholipid phosphatase